MVKHLKVDASKTWVCACFILVALSAATVLLPTSITLLILCLPVILWSLTWRENNLVRFCIILTFLAVIVVPILRIDGSLHGSYRLLVVATLTFVVFALSTRFRPWTLSRHLLIPVGGLLVISLVSTSFAKDRNEWVTFGVITLVTIASIFLAVVARTTGLIGFSWKVMVVLACAESTYAIWELAENPFPLFRGARILPDGTSIRLESDLIPGLERAQGTFGHPLPFAFFLILSALVLILCVRWPWFIKMLAWVLIGAGVIATGSRNALILFVLLSALAYARKALTQRGALVLLVLAAGTLVLWADISSQYARLLSSGSFSHRVGALQSMEVLVLERGVIRGMLGDGAASAPRLFDMGLLQDDGLQAIDNQLVLTLSQQGVIGLLLLLVIIWIAWRRSDMGLKIVLVAIFVECMIFDLLAWPSSTFFAWFFIALAFANLGGAKRASYTPVSMSLKGEPAFQG